MGLEGNQYYIYGLDGQGNKDLHDANFEKNKNAFILGSEGYGIRKNIRDKCDDLLKININNEINSLNVSNASAITLYEFNKKNRP